MKSKFTDNAFTIEILKLKEIRYDDGGIQNYTINVWDKNQWRGSAGSFNDIVIARSTATGFAGGLRMALAQWNETDIVITETSEDFHPVTVKTNFNNPWTEAVPVPVEELAACHANLGMPVYNLKGERFTLTVEAVLTGWGYPAPLDAYILPQPSLWDSAGVRYSNKPSEYLTPACDQTKLAALLKKYKP